MMNEDTIHDRCLEIRQHAETFFEKRVGIDKCDGAAATSRLEIIVVTCKDPCGTVDASHGTP
jgi:hypothetical protein